MTALQTADASPHETHGWHDIDWRAAHRFVRRLQARIVKAVKEGRWRKVKNLQRLLSHSRWARALAVKRVTENKGKRTAGVDGEKWTDASTKWNAIVRLNKRGYRPKPLKRIYILKKNGKKRPLSIPTMLDRAHQALHLQSLTPVAETTADPRSYGFRPERSTADAIAQCYRSLGRSFSAQWILEGDIKGCFDNISHEWLQAHIPMDKDVLSRWLKCGFIEKNQLFPTQEGTPQGGIISPTFANMVLDGLEWELRQRYPKSLRHIKPNPKVNYVRYADDFIVTGATPELLEEEVKPLIEKFLQERGLELSEEKTRITHIDEGFDFLGYNIRKYSGVLRITPSKSNVKRLKQDVKEALKAAQRQPAGELIITLNRKLTGWGNYYRNVSSSDIFVAIDHYIFQCIWRWLKRRHPKKPRRWLRRRYFHTTGSNNWRFSAQDRTGKLRRLMTLSYIRYKRHYQIRGEANPFDSEWYSYFENRAFGQLRKVGASKHIWTPMVRQSGRCYHCQQMMKSEERWRIYKPSTKQSGSQADELGYLVHPDCYAALRHHESRVAITAGSRKRGL